MNLENIGKDCPCYEVDCSDIMFDIGEFCGLPPNNGKLTIQVNGSTVGDFSANQQEDETINITTPTSQDIADAVDSEARLRAEADNTLQSNINAEELARQRADRDIQAVLDGESLARVNEDRNLQSQIDAIASKSDVVDVVGTYAELQAYDTSKLNDNDVVKVLDDSTHNDSMTYYRWNKTTQTWSYIGQESPYYSKSQMDTLLATKQDNLTAGTGITLNGSTISADTTVLAVKSELSNYAEKDNTYTKTEVDNLVEPKLSVEVVEQLPAQGEENKLYLVEKAHTTQTATGNPITATITDGAGQIEDFQLDGDTYQQSYSGKNLFNVEFPTDTALNIVASYSGSVVTLNGNRLGSGTIHNTSNISTVLPAGSYVISSRKLSGSANNDRIRLIVRIGDGSDTTFTTRTDVDETGSSQSFTTTSSQTVSLQIYADSGCYCSNLKIGFMIEAGSTPSDFVPFVGGIASPNPTYPQPIQVVTGTQTIAINGTDYPINLGTIELCKLGTYQDYIYKDGDTWKVHKETATYTFDDSLLSWQRNTQISGGYVLSYNVNSPFYGMLAVGTPSYSSKCTHFTIQNNSTTWTGVGKAGFNSFGAFWCMTNIANLDDFLEWLDEDNPELFYPLATATDTAITDSTLIAQLNAIASASLETGTNTLTNSATGSNLAGDMEVDYFGYDPTNRYDKWLWLDINNAYEKLGS